MIDSESFRPITTTTDYSGRYTDVELIRTTSHAMLYRMRKAGRLFIAKTANGADARSLELLKREYELTLGLSHPNIIHVYTYEADTPVGPALIMEYVDGCTLAEYLAENPGKAARERIFEQLLSATAYLHKAGVLHNDIKPDNVLITRTNHDVRLIDFGFADDDSHYQERMLGGTRGYASSELSTREGVDARSDIYALGCIMQQLFPTHHRCIAKRCLRPDPSKRYANVESLAKAWNHRHRPLRLFGAFVVAFTILLPTYLYINERGERMRYTQGVEREQQMLDSLYQIIDSSYETHYQLTLDSINAIDVAVVEQPYNEALLMVARFYERTGEVKRGVVSSVADKTRQVQLEGYSNHLYSTYQTQLVEAAAPLMAAQFD